MQTYQILENVQQELEHAAFDIKAEAILLQLLEKGIRPEHLMISNNHFFRRGYSRDIVDTVINDDKRGEVLEVILSRAGLLDHLPEGLFFQQNRDSKRLITVADMSKDYKENKRKEEEIRRFFQPLEFDFFLQKLRLEEEECSLLESMQTGMLANYFNNFWHVPEEIPQRFKMSLILLLPYASRIAGDAVLTAQSLQFLLQEEVSICQSVKHVHQAEHLQTVLGNDRLGLDMVCGASFMEGDVCWEVIIGPLVGSSVADYLPGGDRFRLFQLFSDFYIPAGVELQSTIKPPAERMNMLLQKDHEPVLGYTSLI